MIRIIIIAKFWNLNASILRTNESIFFLNIYFNNPVNIMAPVPSASYDSVWVGVIYVCLQAAMCVMHILFYLILLNVYYYVTVHWNDVQHKH